MFVNGWALACVLQLVIYLVNGQSPLASGNLVFAGTGATLNLNGHVWGLKYRDRTKNYTVTVDGNFDNSTAAVLVLALVDGQIWQENYEFMWWAKTVPTDVWLPVYGTPVSPLPNACNSTAGAPASTTCHGYGYCTYYRQCNCTRQADGFTGPYCNTCANGFTFPQCDSKCGDKKCDKAAGETCITCPQDCPSPCGLCGDGACLGSETCTSCPVDCTCKVPCKGDPVCNGQGTCMVTGVCDCNAGYSGPSCSDKTVPIAVNLGSNSTKNSTSSNPGVQIHPTSNSSSPAEKVTFYIGITEVDEVSSTGVVVQSYPLPNITQSFILQNQTANGNIYVATDKIGTTGIKFTLTLYIFTKPTVISFAGQNTTYASGSLKLTVEISNWPFQALTNSILLKLLSSTDLGKQDRCKTFSGYQQQNELKWVQINNGQSALYVQFQSTALIDGYVKPLSFKWLGNGVTGVSIPHFWTNAVLDPSYQLLVDSEKPDSNINIAGCEGKHKIEGWKIAVVVLVIGGAIIIGTLIFIYRERAIKIARAKLFH